MSQSDFPSLESELSYREIKTAGRQSATVQDADARSAQTILTPTIPEGWLFIAPLEIK
jgi:hypothetical protein